MVKAGTATSAKKWCANLAGLFLGALFAFCASGASATCPQYTFVTQQGYVSAAELDANFSCLANLNLAGNVNGIVQGNGLGATSAVTIGSGLTYSGGTLSATGSGGGASFHPGFVSGRWYTPTFMYFAGSAGITPNQLVAEPIYVPTATTFSEIAVQVAAGAAGTNGRLGIYANNGGYPGALEYDAGQVSLANPGIQGTTGSFALSAGWHWLAYIGSSSSALLNYAAVPTNWPSMLGLTNITDSEVIVYASMAYPASLPTTFPASAYATSPSSEVLIFLKD